MNTLLQVSMDFHKFIEANATAFYNAGFDLPKCLELFQGIENMANEPEKPAHFEIDEIIILEVPSINKAKIKGHERNYKFHK